jgi:hypothetical protein
MPKRYGYSRRDDPAPGVTAGGLGKGARSSGASVGRPGQASRIDADPAVAIGGEDSRVTLPPTGAETRKVANVVKKFRGGLVIAGLGSPEGQRLGNVGVIYEQIDGPVAGAGGWNIPLWVKWTGSGSTGWRRIFAGAADKTVYIGGGVGGDGNTEPGTFYIESTCVGMGSLSQTVGGTTIGYASFVAHVSNVNPNAQYGVAVGHSAGIWHGADGIAIGHLARVGAYPSGNSTGGICIGGDTRTTASFDGAYAICLGWGAWTGVGADSNYSIALGAYTRVAGNNVLQIGGDNTASPGTAGISTVIIGNNSSSTVPRSVTIRLTHASPGGTPDQPGAELTIAAGRGVGAGVPGKIFLQTSAPIASGNAAQAVATRLTIDHNAVTTAAGVSLVLSTALDELYGGTGLTSYANGDLIYANAVNTLATLAIGTTGQVLTVVDTGAGDLEPRWQNNAAGFADPMTTRGDIIYRAGAGTTRLAIGTAGQVLTVTDIGAGVLEPRWAASAGGTPAPTNAQYVVLATNATLTDERVLAVAGSLELADGGAGNNATLTGVSELRTMAERQIVKNPGLTTVASVGFSADPVFTGTLANGDDATGCWLTFTTGAVSGNAAGFPGGFVFGMLQSWRAESTWRVKTDAAITSFRTWIGHVSAGLSTKATPTTEHCAAFRYSTDVDGTAFWRCVTHDGGATPTVTTTTAAIATNTAYTLRIVHATGEVRFYVNGTLVATHTTTLPGATTALNGSCTAVTLTAATRAMKFQRVSILYPDF